MNKIEEIKNRVELTNQNKLYHAGDGDVREDLTADWVAEFKEVVDAELFLHARTDISYLLSIIEQAEKALECVANSGARETMRWYAEEALKAIRGEE